MNKNKSVCYGPSTNKPAAQAAGADPSLCKSTNRQNPAIQQNDRYFWTSRAHFMSFWISNMSNIDYYTPCRISNALDMVS